MTPDQLAQFNDMKKRLEALERVENVSFIKLIGRKAKMNFRLSDALDVSATTPATGEVLKWSGTEWAPDEDIDT